MSPASRNKALLGGLAAVIVLALAGALYHGSQKTQALESSAAHSVAGATALLREAAGLALEAPAAAAQLAAQGEALAGHLARLRAEDASRNKALYDAAELYLIDAQAILRNQAGAARSLAASRASSRALAAHLEHAAGRGEGWIRTALALKQRAERDSFELRTALGALAGLYDAHRETQARLRAAAPGAPLLAEEERLRLYQAARAAEAKAEADLERLRRLPIG